MRTNQCCVLTTTFKPPVAKAVFRSTAVALLLILWRVLCWVLVLLFRPLYPSIYTIIFIGRESWLLYFNCLSDVWCSVALPQGAMAWYSVCDYGIT